MKIAFAGTPAFAAAALAALLDAGHEVALVLTQPDRPAGRGQQVQPGAVSALAQARGLPLLQPLTLRRRMRDGSARPDGVAAQERLRAVFDAGAECLVVAAYGLILPQEVLDMPALGCINIHASLLPRWRGAAPIQRAIEAGDAATGITLMRMDAGLDTGPMLARAALPIGPRMSAGELHDALATLGARLVVEHLPTLASLEAVAQPEDGVTYADKLDKAEARIDWRDAAEVLERRMRAFDPVPGVQATLDGETFKLWRSRVVDARGEPGTILASSGGELVVACGRGALAIESLQRAGGRRLGTRAFLAGTPLAPGQRFDVDAR